MQTQHHPLLQRSIDVSGIFGSERNNDPDLNQQLHVLEQTIKG